MHLSSVIHDYIKYPECGGKVVGFHRFPVILHAKFSLLTHSVCKELILLVVSTKRSTAFMKFVSSHLVAENCKINNIIMSVMAESMSLYYV